jgi:hypothetical protein
MPETGRRRRSEALDYMQSMLGELRTMAKAERYDILAYLVEMAYLEASDLVRAKLTRGAASDPDEPLPDDPR